MCGIVGYAGGRNAVSIVLDGLKRLEYRGYDSAGIVVNPGGDSHSPLPAAKKGGKLTELIGHLRAAPLPEAPVGLGHTRWATHGAPTDVNAHPHFDSTGQLALIHNGIIENYASLKQELLAVGVEFHSETDTEVVAHLLGQAWQETRSLTAAFRRVALRLEGAFTLLATHRGEPETIVGIRRNSPLVVGLGDDENFLASDVAAFAEHTRRAMALGQDEVVEITAAGVQVSDLSGRYVTPEEFNVSWVTAAADKQSWPSFMLKEIFEEPQAVEATLEGRLLMRAPGVPGEQHSEADVDLEELRDVADRLGEINRIVLLGCGTAAYAGQTARYSLENWVGIPVDVELSHEYRYRDPIIDKKTLVISISQSGETMDTLMAVRYARERGALTLALCNVEGSSIPRESHATVYVKAGPEVAVASTKSFICQVVALYLFALHLARLRGSLEHSKQQKILRELLTLPTKIKQALTLHSKVQRLARWMSDSRAVLFLGRQVGYPIALEAALKLKELAYIHAEGFAAGELKHGPIALIEAGQPVFVVVPSPYGSPLLHAKVVSNIQEIRARGARVIAVAEVGDAAVLPHADEVLAIPLARSSFEPLLALIPLQLFALELAEAKGYDVDKPRNLAKSVTVE